MSENYNDTQWVKDITIANDISVDVLSNVKYAQATPNQIVEQVYFSIEEVFKYDVTAGAEMQNLANKAQGRVLVISEAYTVVWDNSNLENGKYLMSNNIIEAMKGKQIIDTSKDSRYIEIYTPIRDTTNERVVGIVILMTDSNPTVEYKENIYKHILAIMPIAIVILLLISCYYAINIYKPYRRLITSMKNITDGNINEKIEIDGHGEIEDIATAFNEMTARIEETEISRQEFVSNVSHELKTPITSIKILADSLLQQEGIPVETYKEFLADIVSEIDREDKIINDLLSLVKLDKKNNSLNITSVNIDTLFEQILHRLTPIANKRNVEIIYESFKEVMAEIDEMKFTLAISNLVENAIKYNRENGWVKVSLNSDHKYMYIKISDCGIGIPKESIDKIYNRFYRVDKARSRETGGTGLGLAITRNAILMHKGSIKVHSEENVGTDFSIRVPLYNVQKEEIEEGDFND